MFSPVTYIASHPNLHYLPKLRAERKMETDHPFLCIKKDYSNTHKAMYIKDTSEQVFSKMTIPLPTLPN